ncbi:hypothetical protein BDV39DRAFT_201080 [Aspergillus sergii]|uniref:Uncharacterized protein n=1 Tax=Aspergillus sergii TaxID=1034303 RepID=A0A5N6XH37_9EURO|nr:hypothetical protein BDV39DRAFT_201080 [Aspergillus sergii]
MTQDRGAQDAKAIFADELRPIRPTDDQWWAAKFNDKEFYFDSGFVIRAVAETGEDVHFWSIMYHQKCNDVIIHCDLTQTVLLVTKFSEDEKKHMHATRFIDLGQNVEDFLPLGSFKVTETSKGAKWEAAGREFLSEPPHWYIRGEHAGVKTDLHLFNPSDGFFHLGLFENWKPDGSAGYQTHLRAEGTIEYEGRKLRIKGWAVHENLGFRGTTMGIPNRIGYMGDQGLYWAHGFSDEFSWYILSGHAERNATGMVVIDGKTIHATGQSNVWVETIKEWIDPESNQLVPCKWRTYLRAPEGLLETYCHSYSRTYYTWNRLGGVIVVYHLVGEAEATFTHADGRVLKAPKQLFFTEFMRTLTRRNKLIN